MFVEAKRNYKKASHTLIVECGKLLINRIFMRDALISYALISYALISYALIAMH
jgi:hypothetical protein